MRKTLLACVLLASCASVPTEPVPSNDQEMAVLLAMAYDPAHLREGQWALYMIRRAGEAISSAVKLQVVKQERDGSIWIELRLPERPHPVIVKSKIDRVGRLLEQWMIETGSKNFVQTYPRTGPDGRPVEPPVTKGPDAKADVQVSDEAVTAGGKPFLCKKVTTKLSYAGGRTTTLVHWCHPDVPFSFRLGRESLGGVVKREYGKYVLELADFGQTGARAEFEIPRR